MTRCLFATISYSYYSPARRRERDLINLVNLLCPAGSEEKIFFLLAGERDLVDYGKKHF